MHPTSRPRPRAVPAAGARRNDPAGPERAGATARKGRASGLALRATVLALGAALLIGMLCALAPFVGGAAGDAPGDAAPASEEERPWNLTLVNAAHPLPDDFTVETAEMPGGELVDARIAEPLTAMFRACEADSHAPTVRSGFRTRAQQERILEERIASYEQEGYAADDARAEALRWVALPGTSEHELGLAVDINDAGDDGVYDWLAANAARFGFIQRYPDGSERITGIDHEPWHYRYVGVEAAEQISARGITLEEYLGEA